LASVMPEGVLRSIINLPTPRSIHGKADVWTGGLRKRVGETRRAAGPGVRIARLDPEESIPFSVLWPAG